MSNELNPSRRTFGVPQKRQEIVDVLTRCYAEDYLELEEFERRVGLAQHADTLEDIESLVADVPEPLRSPLPARAPIDAGPVVLRGSVKRLGAEHLRVGNLDLTLIASTVRADYRLVELAPGSYEVRVEAKGSNLRIIVPPEVEVVESLSMEGSVVKIRRPRRYRGMAAPIQIRLVGVAKGSVIRVRTRRRRSRSRSRQRRIGF